MASVEAVRPFSSPTHTGGTTYWWDAIFFTLGPVQDLRVWVWVRIYVRLRVRVGLEFRLELGFGMGLGLGAFWTQTSVDEYLGSEQAWKKIALAGH